MHGKNLKKFFLPISYYYNNYLLYFASSDCVVIQVLYSVSAVLPKCRILSEYSGFISLLKLKLTVPFLIACRSHLIIP